MDKIDDHIYFSLLDKMVRRSRGRERETDARTERQPQAARETCGDTMT